MSGEISLRAQLENWKAGKYLYKDIDTQVEAGWYDWFCKDSSLAGKTKTMGNIVKQIQDGGKINPKTGDTVIFIMFMVVVMGICAVVIIRKIAVKK